MSQSLAPTQCRRVYTPTLLQMEAVECGAASLGIVLGYFGRFVPLAELRQECGVSRDGSKASNVLKAARRYGLEAKGFSKPLEALRDLTVPFVVFWEFNHFLVVEEFGTDRVRLNDPAQGHVCVSLDDFDRGYTGVVLTMKPGAEFKRAGRPVSVWPGLWRRLKSNVGALVYCILVGLMLILPGIALPIFSQVFVDSVLLEGRIGWYRPLLLGMAGILFLQLVLTFLQQTCLRRLKLALSIKLAGEYNWHLLRLPMSFYAQRYAGEVTERCELNSKVADALSGRLAKAVLDACTMVFYGVVMLCYDPLLAFITASFALASLIAMIRLSRVRVEANMKAAQEEGKLGAVALAGLQSIETLKASGMEEGFFRKWAGHHAAAHNAAREMESSSMPLSIVPVLLQSVVSMLIWIVGSVRVLDGELSIGMLVAFTGFAVAFLAPVEALLGMGNLFQELRGDVLRLDDVLQNPAAESPPDRSTTPELPPRLKGSLEICGLTFGYSPLDPPLISNFNLVVRPGRRVALVGGSGSGKSSLARLICGLFEPWSGDILIDGLPRTQVPIAILANTVGFVEQDILIFEASVRDNLTLWDRTVPDDVIVQACCDAAINDVIAEMPGGYSSLLQEGGKNLSGGQRQRLEIARALVNNPAVLILDEATSALDPETERLIDENLRRRGCACVIVAHRLSTIRDCDEIIVLERGKVVERGTHEQLWAQGGAYAKLLKQDDQVEASEAA